MADFHQREQAQAEGKLGIVPEPFTLFWVWHNDGWHLAKSNGSNFTVFMPVDFQISNVVQGPFAAEIPAAPASKPVYIEPLPQHAAPQCPWGSGQCTLKAGHPGIHHFPDDQQS